jgi:hypothetical protein
MKIFKLLLLLVLPFTSFAQVGLLPSNTPLLDSTSVNEYMYCEILGTSKFFSNKVTVQIDYGQQTSFWRGGWDMRLLDEQTGRAQSFNSMVDALNYMGGNGWEFVQAYTITIGQQNVYHWLLKRKNR